MADNIRLNPGSAGDVVAADDIGGAKYQRIKLIHGVDGTNSGDVSTANPLPSKLFGSTPSGLVVPLPFDSQCRLLVSLPRTAFGELSVAHNEPVAQVDFVTQTGTLNTQHLVTSAVTGSGTTTASGGLLSCSTTAAINSSAQVVSRRYLRYRTGEGGLGRFTALFTMGVSGSNQYAGLGTASLNDGFFFGYSGATFGIFHINAGLVTHMPQSTWNVDLCDGSGGASNKSGITLDPTKGNVYQIRYQYLGFGAIVFYVEDSSVGEFVPVHVIQYANSHTSPSLGQPCLNLLWRAENTSNASNVVVKSASGALFVEGIRRHLGPRWGTDNSKTVTTLLNVLAIRNATTYNGITNAGQIRIRNISLCANTSSPTGVATLRIVRLPSLGGSPVFTPISGTSSNGGVTITAGQSIASVDTSGTTIGGGTVIFNASVAIGASQVLDVSNLDIYANPGETLSFGAVSTQSATVGVSVTWNEDI